MWKTPAFAVCLSSVHSKNIVDLCQIHGLRTDAEKMWSANQAKGMEVTLFFHTVPGALACRRLSDSREVAKKGSAWPGEEYMLEPGTGYSEGISHAQRITDHCTCFQYSVGSLSRVKQTNDTTTINENSLMFYYLRFRQGACGCKVIRSRISRTVISLENR